jgi:predicted nucleotidyltransferase
VVKKSKTLCWLNNAKWDIRIMTMTNNYNYQPLIDKLTQAFKGRIKTVVLFGSRARGQVIAEKDHDIFVVIEKLPASPLQRQKEIRSAIRDVDMKINTIAKTPEEVAGNLTPLLLEICVDGVCLHGSNYFEPYRRMALKAIKQAGLKKKRVGREWYWMFDSVPDKEWELSWEGFREHQR